jgi:6-phosphogluconolactonase (cycloisomerase 2 family)
VDPSGNFVYAASALDQRITVLSIDQVTGEMTPVPGSPFVELSNPNSLAV